MDELLVDEAVMTAKIQELGGTVVGDVVRLPDGSCRLTASFPLPEDHWLTRKSEGGFEPPPMPMRMGRDHPRRKGMKAALVAAARYAVRCATMNGTEADFDPDALIQCLCVGMMGYHTGDGLSDDDWANPIPLPEMAPR